MSDWSYRFSDIARAAHGQGTTVEPPPPGPPPPLIGLCSVRSLNRGSWSSAGAIHLRFEPAMRACSHFRWLLVSFRSVILSTVVVRGEGMCKTSRHRTPHNLSRFNPFCNERIAAILRKCSVSTRLFGLDGNHHTARIRLYKYSSHY